jgi:CHAT domain-containing protein
LPLEERVLAIREKVLGAEHPDTAMALNNLAVTYSELGKQPEALPLQERVLAIREKVLGAEHPDTVMALGNLAVTYSDLGDYAKALPLEERVLAIREKALGTEHPDTTHALLSLAITHWRLGEYTEALPLAERALAIREKVLGPEHPETAEVLHNLNIIYSELGEYTEALAAGERALAIREKVLGLEHSETADTMHWLAMTLGELGMREEALSSQKEVLRIWLKNQEDPDGEWVMWATNNLAESYNDLGSFREALPHAKRALLLQEQIFGPNHPEMATSLDTLANTYDGLGMLGEAFPLRKRALSIRQEKLGMSHPSLAYFLIKLADLHRKMIEEKQASILEIRALSISEKSLGGGHPLTAIARSLVGSAFFDARFITEGLTLQKMAVNNIQATRASVNDLGKEAAAAYSEKVQYVYQSLADALLSSDRIPEAQQVLEMLKEQEYSEFSRRSDASTSLQTIAYTAEEAEWREWYLSIVFRSDFIDLMNDPARFEGKRTSAATPDDPTRQVANSGRYRTLLRSLGPDVALAQYYVSQAEVGFILTTADGQKVYKAPIKAEEVTRKKDQWRAQLRDPKSDPVPLAKEFYQILIGPAEQDLAKMGVKTLMVAPDGVLRYLPFSALHDGEDYLVKRLELPVYTGVAQERLRERDTPRWTAAGFGVTRGFDDFPALPAVRKELTHIIGPESGGLLPGAIHLDEEFTPEALREATERRYPLMHVASHYRFSPGTEVNSYLLLGNGHHLSLGELREQGYRFDGVDLLTLSACETALGGGRDRQGKEIEGFGTLAQKLGAKAVIATLWKVADESTAKLMVDIYRRREQGAESKIGAVREAQLSLMEQDKYTHPYYWAPFILMGNWR